MCESCSKYTRLCLRPVEDISASDWARLARARRIADPEKLQAMLPAYIKRHQAVNQVKPFRFVPNQPPHYPVTGTRLTDGRAIVFKRFLCGMPNEISLTDYIRCWDDEQGFKPAMQIGENHDT